MPVSWAGGLPPRCVWDDSAESSGVGIGLGLCVRVRSEKSSSVKSGS